MVFLHLFHALLPHLKSIVAKFKCVSAPSPSCAPPNATLPIARRQFLLAIRFIISLGRRSSPLFALCVSPNLLACRRLTPLQFKRSALKPFARIDCRLGPGPFMCIDTCRPLLFAQPKMNRIDSIDGRQREQSHPTKTPNYSCSSLILSIQTHIQFAFLLIESGSAQHRPSCCSIPHKKASAINLLFSAKLYIEPVNFKVACGDKHKKNSEINKNTQMLPSVCVCVCVYELSFSSCVSALAIVEPIHIQTKVLTLRGPCRAQVRQRMPEYARSIGND